MVEYNDKEKKIIKQCNEGPFYTIVTELTQDEFDELVNKLMKEDQAKTLTILVSIYWDYNRNKIIDYFINKKDVEELLSFLDYCNDFSTEKNQLDQKYIVDKILETSDKQFIKKILESNNLYFLNDESEKDRLLKYIA